MHNHINKTYSGVKNAFQIHSFFANGFYTDCIPIMEQPSVQLFGIESLASTIGTPPVAPAGDNSTCERHPRGWATSLLTHGLEDEFGNAIKCQTGAISMHRLTLEL